MENRSLYKRLRSLIGQRFDYAGEVWILIEVLADDDSVVLRRCDECETRSVQRNAFGMPTRRTTETLTMSISDRDSDDYSDDILLLLEGRQPDSGA